MTQPTPSPALVAAFAPGGTLRASINLGNPILANKNAATGEPVGVSVDLAREFARRLGVGVELVVFEKAAASVDAVRAEKADIGFFAIDPARSEGLLFTAPYVLIEGSYLVPETSALRDNAQVDARGPPHLGRRGQRLRPVPHARDRSREIVRLQGAGPALVPRCERRSRWPRVRQMLEAEATRPRRARAAGALHGDPAGHGHAGQPRQPTRRRCSRPSWKR
jgi:polar amino acid transport system substrate-binding protein